jgi:hypothetical protein
MQNNPYPHKKGLNIVSKKSDNCVSNTFSKFLEKTGRTLTVILHIIYPRREYIILYLV